MRLIGNRRDAQGIRTGDEREREGLTKVGE